MEVGQIVFLKGNLNVFRYVGKNIVRGVNSGRCYSVKKENISEHGAKFFVYIYLVVKEFFKPNNVK